MKLVANDARLAGGVPSKMPLVLWILSILAMMKLSNALKVGRTTSPVPLPVPLVALVALVRANLTPTTRKGDSSRMIKLYAQLGEAHNHTC